MATLIRYACQSPREIAFFFSVFRYYYVTDRLKQKFTNIHDLI